MTTLLSKAATALELKAKQIKRLHESHEADMMYSGGSIIVGNGIGAGVDIRFGDNGAQAKLGPVPVNIIAGIPIGILGIALKPLGRARAPVAALGFSLAGVGLYRLILDKHAEHVAANPPAAQ